MKPNTISYGIHDRELLGIIQAEDAKLKADATKRAKHFAANYQPALAGESIESYFGTTTAGYGKLAVAICEHTKPETHAAQAQAEHAAFQKKLAELKKEVSDREHELQTLEFELDGKTPPKSGKSIMTMLILIVTYLADIAFNAWSFEFLGHNLLVALIVGAFIAVGTDMSARGILHFLGKRTELGKRAYYIAGTIATVMSAIFFGLAQLRAAVTDGTETPIGPWFFFAMNIFLLVTSILIRYFFFPTRAQTEDEREIAAKFAARDACKTAISALCDQIQKRTAEHRERMNGHMQVISITAHALDQVHALYREAFALFKSTNLMYRPDRRMPLCFNDAMPELQRFPDLPTISLNDQAA